MNRILFALGVFFLAYRRAFIGDAFLEPIQPIGRGPGLPPFESLGDVHVSLTGQTVEEEFASLHRFYPIVGVAGPTPQAEAPFFVPQLTF